MRLLEHDFNEKNTTLSIGVNDENDIIQPIGGTPVALSDYAAFDKTGNQSKNGAGVLLGVTQVMTRHWLTELSCRSIDFPGYLNDPYKIVSVIDATATRPATSMRTAPEVARVAALTGRIGSAASASSAALSLRYMTDTWGIALRYGAAAGSLVEPPQRSVSGADRALVSTDCGGLLQGVDSGLRRTKLSYVSSDFRLGAFAH